MTSAAGLSIDSTAGKLYWTDELGGIPRLMRANLDGSDIETLVSTSGPAFDSTALNVGSEQIFWIAGDTIRRASLDGSDNIALITFDSPSGIAFDEGSDRVYVTSVEPAPPFNGEIVSLNTDGSGLATVLADQAAPSFIAITPRTADGVPATSARGVAILALVVLLASAVMIRRWRPRSARGR